jgi:hypothetical protein
MRVPNQYRVRTGLYGSDESYGNNGMFIVPFESYEFRIIASDGEGWEHVSLSLKNRTPNWKEMCFFKNMFWGEEETVIQFHPPKSEYVNNCETCLHLWKPRNHEIMLPPSILV